MPDQLSTLAAAAGADELFPGFASHIQTVDGAKIFMRIGGQGPPLLCLHGYPQTHTMWHRLAPVLAGHFTVCLADLRGYGQSSAPPDTAGHAAYAKRTMANDLVAAMQCMGYETFTLIGHDRGARVSYRMALDHPHVVTRLVSLDVIPTLDVWETMTPTRMMRMFHWTFLAQPAPFPERWLSHDPAAWVAGRMMRGSGEIPDWVDPRALAHDQACFADPGHLTATCADYRAGAAVDVEHDRADRAEGRKIQAPFAVFWGTRGNLRDGPDPIATWSRWCEAPVEGSAIDAGHFIAQENPDDLLAGLRPFLLEA